jgi:hypothetical protein
MDYTPDYTARIYASLSVRVKELACEFMVNHMWGNANSVILFSEHFEALCCVLDLSNPWS